MGITELLALAESKHVFAGLFIICLFFVGRWAVGFIQSIREENSTREDQLLELHEQQATKSAVREEKLMEHLEKTADQQDKFVDQLEKITDTQVQLQESLGKLENKIDVGLTEVWKELGGKVDK